MGGSSESREVKIAGRLWRRPSKSSVEVYRKGRRDGRYALGSWGRQRRVLGGRLSKGRGGWALLSNGNAGPLAECYRWRRGSRVRVLIQPQSGRP